MSLVAVVGDCTTTTAVAMASSWPAHDDVVILEADRSGGSLTGWLDTPPTPSLSTIVANAHTHEAGHSTAWFAIDSMVRQTSSGIRFIAAPLHAREASRAIVEASTTLFPMLASRAEPTVLADCGRHIPADPLPAALSLASAIVVVHRQHPASARAASVRLEQVAEVIQDLASIGVPIELGVIGNRPFDLDEIHRYVSGGDTTVAAHALADDALSAAVFAGRAGVSAKRLRRLPLLRSVRDVTAAVRRSIGVADGAAWLDALGTAP